MARHAKKCPSCGRPCLQAAVCGAPWWFCVMCYRDAKATQEEQERRQKEAEGEGDATES